jgi:hypothetical protein
MLIDGALSKHYTLVLEISASLGPANSCAGRNTFLR